MGNEMTTKRTKERLLGDGLQILEPVAETDTEWSVGTRICYDDGVGNTPGAIMDPRLSDDFDSEDERLIAKDCIDSDDGKMVYAMLDTLDGSVGKADWYSRSSC